MYLLSGMDLALIVLTVALLMVLAEIVYRLGQRSVAQQAAAMMEMVVRVSAETTAQMVADNLGPVDLAGLAAMDALLASLDDDDEAEADGVDDDLMRVMCDGCAEPCEAAIEKGWVPAPAAEEEAGEPVLAPA
jgi:hypothetical protein